MASMPSPSGESTAGRGGLWATLKAVGAAFFGVRGRGQHEQDFANLNPIHVIGAGLVLAAIFVLVLVLIVRWVVA